MKPRYTLGMLLVLGLLAAYVFFFERNPVTQENNTPKTQILNVQPDQVKQISIEKKEKKLVLTKSTSGQWQIKAPQTSPADQNRVNSLLDHLRDWPAAQVLETDFKGQKREFGLEPPQINLQLETKTGPVRVLIGHKTPINSGYYVLVPPKNQLMLSYINIPEELEQMLNTPPTPTPTPTQTSTPTSKASSR